MYRGVFEILLRLFSAYGGIKALFLSPYVHFAAILTVIFYNFSNLKTINDISISIIPSILGFSIGAYAIIFGVMGEKIVSIIAKKEENSEFSDLTRLSSSFAWYVLMQSMSLIISVSIFLISKDNIIEFINFNCAEKYINATAMIANFISCFLFFYALLLSAAIVLEIFRISTFREQ